MLSCCVTCYRLKWSLLYCVPIAKSCYGKQIIEQSLPWTNPLFLNYHDKKLTAIIIDSLYSALEVEQDKNEGQGMKKCSARHKRL